MKLLLFRVLIFTLFPTHMKQIDGNPTVQSHEKLWQTGEQQALFESQVKELYHLFLNGPQY